MEQRVPASIEEMLDPRRAALVLWDMQDGVASRAHNRDELVPVVQAVLSVARSADVAVIWALHVPANREFTPASKLRYSMRREGVANVADLRGPAASPKILDGFEVLDGEWLIEKPTQ